MSLVDLAPTVLDGFGLPAPTPFDGHSLWPLLAASRPLPDRPIFAEGLHHRAPKSAVVRWPNKIIVNHVDGFIDVFDLARDPHERQLLGAAASEIKAALTADLCRHQGTARVLGFGDTRTPTVPGQDVLERLRSLGYLRVSTDAPPRLLDHQFPCFADTAAGPVIHVRWSEALGAPARTELEQALGLHSGAHYTETTWKYRASDPSPDGLRAIVNHELVEDTNGFDRSTLEFDRSEFDRSRHADRP